MSLRKSAISGVKWTTVGVIGRALFQLIQISILTRFLPKEAFGLVAMALFVVNFSNIFADMGMTSAILHRQEATKKEYSSIYWLNIFISLLLYTILYLSASWVAIFYNEPELKLLIPIISISLLLMAIGRQHRTIMQKQFQFKAIAIIEIIAILFGLLTATILAIKNFGVYSLVYSTLTTAFISNSLFLVLNFRLNPITMRFRLSEAKPFLKVGGFTMGSSMLDFFSRDIDVLIIGKMLGADNLGIYTLAKQIVMRLYSMVNPIVINVLNPIFSSIQKEKNRLKHYYLKVVYFLSSINFPLYLLLIVLSKEILIIIYGTEYSSGYLVLSFLALSFVTYTINSPVGTLQVATGRTDIGFKWTIYRLIVTPITILIAAQISIEAVAGALAILSILLALPLWYVQLRPMASIKLNEYLNQFIKPFVFLVLISVGFLITFSFYSLPFNIVVASVIKGGIALSLFFVLLWVFDKPRLIQYYKIVLKQLKSKT